MASESTGSCAAAPRPGSPFRKEAMNPQNTPDRGVKQRSPCFHCNEEGHWFKDCPSRKKASPVPAGPAAGEADGAGYPELQCPCGRGACVVLTSKTERNPGRDFYRCPVFPVSEKCVFFKWCDTVVSNPQHGAKSPAKLYQQRGDGSPVKPGYGVNSPTKPEWRNGINSPVKNLEQQFGVRSPGKPEQRFNANGPVKPVHCGRNESHHPMCSCGAGRCRVLIMQDGDNAGRKYFGCTIKKGQGACNFFQWYDTAAKPLEMKNENLDCNVVSSFELVPAEANNLAHGMGGEGGANNLVHEVKDHEMDGVDEAKVKDHEMDGVDEAKDGGGDLVPEVAGDHEMGEAGEVKDGGSNLVPAVKSDEMDDDGAAEGKDGGIPKGMLSDVSIVPASPSPTSREHQVNRGAGEFSPIKRLSLDEGSPAGAAPRPGKCFKCGKEGHWMSECAGAYPCFKCGKFGHWRKDCTT